MKRKPRGKDSWSVIRSCQKSFFETVTKSSEPGGYQKLSIQFSKETKATIDYSVE